VSVNQDPREERTTGGDAPTSKRKTLVHGDYFSANILSVRDGLKIIDWETFGWGDPMWDLGFLIGAD
jgi:aminoglycoside phosphotransferase (APT) family kinase protein